MKGDTDFKDSIEIIKDFPVRRYQVVSPDYKWGIMSLEGKILI